jgi:TolA-binding protein
MPADPFPPKEFHMFRRVCVWILIAAPAVFGASKEIQELQRDVAQLQDQLRQLQQSQEKQFTVLTTLVQTTLDAANRASTAVAVIQNGLQQNVRENQEKVVAPVVGLGTRLDGLANDVRTLQGAVADLTSLLTKMQAQLTDLGNAVKVMQTPAPPPPGVGQAAPPAAGGAPEGAPPIPASDLYANATRDYSSGKREIAGQEFNEYLKWYGNTELAPNAQFYIGMIYYGQGNYEPAANAFDIVLEKYSKNPKTADSMYYKGLSLLRLPGRRNQAADEFKELVREFPNTDRAKDACRELTNLGLNTCRFPASSPSKRASKKK